MLEMKYKYWSTSCSTGFQFNFQITISAEKLEKEPFIFGDFLDVNAPTNNRIYRHLPDRKTLTTLLDEYYLRIRSLVDEFVKVDDFVPHEFNLSTVIDIRAANGQLVNKLLYLDTICVIAIMICNTLYYIISIKFKNDYLYVAYSA